MRPSAAAMPRTGRTKPWKAGLRLLLTLTLCRAAADAQTAQPVTEAPPRPKFEASGIRGLIDPGGYSAPANAAAASSLLSGMAQVNRDAPGNCGPVRPLAELEAEYKAAPVDAVRLLAYAEGLLRAQQFAMASEVLSYAPTPGVSAASLLQLQARAAEGTGNFAEAARRYAALQQRAPSETNLFAEGYELMLAGRVADAAALFAQSLRSAPQSVALRIGAATAAFLQGHAAETTQTLLQAAESDPADVRPYPFLAAVSATHSAEYGRVTAALQLHLARAPRDAAAHLALANVLLHGPVAAQADVLKQAEKELRQALALDPALADAHVQLGMLLAGRSPNDEAVRELQLAVALDPARREPHYRLALLLRKTGQPAEAAREMQLFQQARAADAAGNSDVRQYLSVMQHAEVASGKDCAGR